MEIVNYITARKVLTLLLEGAKIKEKTNFKEDSTMNEIEKLWQEYRDECEDIAEECAAEGYPNRGDNYELRCASLYTYYEGLEKEMMRAVYNRIIGVLESDIPLAHAENIAREYNIVLTEIWSADDEIIGMMVDDITIYFGEEMK